MNINNINEIRELKTRTSNVFTALYNAGFSSSIIPFILIQSMLESAYFTSFISTLQNNPSNIKYYAGQPNATKGRAATDGGNFATFTNLAAWAKELKKILTKGSNPAAATNLIDFVHRLKQNNYFGKETEQNYFNGMKGIANNLLAAANKYPAEFGTAKNWLTTMLAGAKEGAKILVDPFGMFTSDSTLTQIEQSAESLFSGLPS